MIPNFWWFVAAGFAAQLIDGALGMAYGVSATTLLLAYGVTPAAASATVHAAECFTTGASAISHHAFNNVDRALFKRLVFPGVAGAVVGAYVLTSFPGDELKPAVALYLLGMGLLIIWKAVRRSVPAAVTTHIAPLGFFGALLDSLGGGGWGPVVATTLIARGNGTRETVGTVNSAEFFVTVASSITFLATIGVSHWQMVLALALGGLPAAPIAAWACARLPVRGAMTAVGILVVTLSVRTLILSHR